MLILDVDGVLNPFAWRGPAEGAFADFEEHVARGFRLLLSRQMGAELCRLPAEICWATTWSDWVDTDIAPFAGLPRGLRVAARIPLDADVAASNWKLAQVRAFVEREQRPFAWLDDEALDTPGADGKSARDWAGALELPSFLLAPSPACGLTPGEVRALAEWLEAPEVVAV